MLSHIEAPSQEVVEVAFRTIARWLELTTPRSWHFDDVHYMVGALTTRDGRAFAVNSVPEALQFIAPEHQVPEVCIAALTRWGGCQLKFMSAKAQREAVLHMVLHKAGGY
jgi:hypothetical protein